jgi:SAM-dependent methyltransferase
MELNDEFWSKRYELHQTGWDLHKASPPLKAFIDQWPDINSRVLIPGCGNAYEADYLLQKGFTQITLIDISHVLTEHLQEHFKGHSIQIIHGDFFDHEGTYDLVLEQTFFCAINPALREQYVLKMKSILAPDGVLAGVLFNRDFEGGPPFGGSLPEYIQLFSPHFQIKTLETCYNSIPARQNTELFIQLINGSSNA